MQYSIDPEKKLGYLRIPEKTDLTEILEALRQLAADERFGDDFGLLVDVRATSYIPTAGEARAIAAEISRPALFLSRPVAAVVLQPVQYGISNMVSIMPV